MLKKELYLLGLGTTADSQNSVLVLADEKSERAIPIWIAEADAINISNALVGSPASHPFPHEALSRIIESLDCEIDYVEIRKVANGIFYTDIHIRKQNHDQVQDQDSEEDGTDIVLDARPSDAVALAVWSGVPIYVDQEVFAAKSAILEVCGNGFNLVEDSVPDSEEDQEIRSFLANVKASDFKLDSED